MFTLLKQETMKAWKQNRVYIWATIIFVLPMITLPFVLSASTQAAGFAEFGGSSIVLSIFITVIAALTFSQEFTFGTIRPLLSRQYSRLQVFISKLLIILIQAVLMTLIAFVGSFIGRQIFIWMHGKTGTSIDFGQFFYAQGISFLVTLFFIAIVLLIASVAKSAAAAISLGIVMSMVTSIISTISIYLVQFWSGLKWNPFTILEAVRSYDGTFLSKLQYQAYFGTDPWVIFTVYGVYLVLIYGLAYWIFNRRSV